MSHDAAFADALGTRRLRAAADMAHAAIAYGDVLADATVLGARPRRDPAVQAAAAYVKQTRFAYDDARADHERALSEAASDSLCATTAGERQQPIGAPTHLPAETALSAH